MLTHRLLPLLLVSPFDTCFLLVEDNRDDIRLMELAFERLGFKPPPVAHDGQEAIDYLLNRKNPVPHAILLDLKMPGMGGLEFLRWLRRESPKTMRSLVGHSCVQKLGCALGNERQV